MKTYQKFIFITSTLGILLAPVVASAMACRSCSRGECQQLADKYNLGYMTFNGPGTCTYAHGGSGSDTGEVAIDFEDALKKSEAINRKAGKAVSSQKLMKKEPSSVSKALPVTK
ncbi:hypothetical protein [Sulfitobacter guttiformis]|uniref:Periplasmic protein n=1 Tax=Sulfitobacter guttiformis TaxID=74349 RepID=A0A420DH26_9RHOB|nr:hypothetical protein [Sulfitobacter guttiformis]KIN72763.1 hypothetical protein Z949_1942 [Sulfitobacter guttiformis KCTC 32187]RKE93528.1 hypothetical protein C8N30_2586 [Sulfitobacter guttiformis]